MNKTFKIKLYSEGKGYKLYQGNMLDMLDVIEPNSIDSIVTDPPYELGFMNKGWDASGIAFQKDTWGKCYTALKSGGYLLAFGGTKTFHRIACAIEDAGFEIRDTIMWLYGSGFPKSMNIARGIEAKLTTGSANKTEFKDLNGEKVKRGNYGYATMNSEQGARPVDYNNIDADRLGRLDATTDEAKQWDGWGTCLKPAYEPIIVARKPCEGSCIDNVLKYGVGGINIDECRIPFQGDKWKNQKCQANDNGRFPSNVILTYDESDFDEVCGGMPETTQNGTGGIRRGADSIFTVKEDGRYKQFYTDEGSVARYFYCAKASQKDRDEGLDVFNLVQRTDGSIRTNQETAGKFGANSGLGKNTHPTVKPCELMQYLVRLVTPSGGTVLDPFNGSGSTGKAVMYENRERVSDYKYIGIELTEEYLPIADARISCIANQKHKRRLI